MRQYFTPAYSGTTRPISSSTSAGLWYAQKAVCARPSFFSMRPARSQMICQVGPRLAARFQRFAHALDAAVGVGECAFLLRPGSRGQKDVGKGAGLVDEQVLRHEELQLFHHVARVVQVGLGHHRILAHDVQRAHAARPDLAHDLGRRQPQLAVERARLDIPCLLEFARRRFVIDPLITGIVPGHGAASPTRPARCFARAVD